MRRIWLGEDRRNGAIVLEVFWCVGLGIVELWKYELVNTGENNCWLYNFDELTLCNIVYFLQLYDMFREVRYVGWDCGRVFS